MNATPPDRAAAQAAAQRALRLRKRAGLVRVTIREDIPADSAETFTLAVERLADAARSRALTDV